MQKQDFFARLIFVGMISGGIVPAEGKSLRRVGDEAVYRAVGSCRNPCVIQYNRGGPVVDFEDAADAIRRGARRALVIDGYCGSSCMVLADRARAKTCITPRAVFAYHKTNFNRPIPLRRSLNRWIYAHGGFPPFSGQPGIMPNSAARKFWPLCNSDIAGR